MDESQTTEYEISSMNELVAELHKVFAEDVVNVDHVKKLLESYESKTNHWKKYVHFDPYRYTRNLVDNGNERFNLMLLCWGEGHSSSIHDHSDAHCFVKILSGHLKETLYDWPDAPNPPPNPPSDPSTTSKRKQQVQGIDTKPMKQKDTRWYSKEQVAYINDSMGLHRMENPSHSDRTVSLHLYSPPFGSCNMFDERTGQKRTARMTFWSKPLNGGQLQELNDAIFLGY